CASVSAGKPAESNLRTRSAPSVVRTSAAAGSTSPAPASIVSPKCNNAESSGPSAAAMPPWARAVFPAEIASAPKFPAVKSVTGAPAVASRSTAVSPATPAPTTTIMVGPPACAPVQPMHRLKPWGLQKFGWVLYRQPMIPGPRLGRQGECDTWLNTDKSPGPGRRLSYRGAGTANGSPG